MRRIHWLGVTILVGVTASANPSISTRFPAGSLIIPMDVCYQNADLRFAGYDKTFPGYCPGATVRTNGQLGANTSSGATRAYGLVWRLLQQSPAIPVNVIVASGKSTVSQVDLNISGSAPVVRNLLHPSGGSLTTADISLAAIDYHGGPFVIDAAYAGAVRTFLAGDAARSSPRFANVIVHEARIGFAADVNQTLSGNPVKMAVLNIPDESPIAAKETTYDTNHRSYGYETGFQPTLCAMGLDESSVAGCCSDPGGGYGGGSCGSSEGRYGGTSGTVFDRFDSPASLASGLGPGGYDLLFLPHWVSWTNDGKAAGTQAGTANQTTVNTTISSFLDAGGALFASCAAISGFETASNNDKVATRTMYGTPTSPGPLMTTNGVYVNSVDIYGNGNWSGLVPTPLGVRATEPWTFGDPSSLLTQIGDFGLVIDQFPVHVENFHPHPARGSTYRAGVQKMVTLASPNMELETFFHKDNNPARGPIVYMGQHGLMNALAGQRLVMNAILMIRHLNPLPTPELTRSSPVAYGGRIYQGTYIETAASTTYPPTPGHFREYSLASLSGANVSAFDAVTANWDAADLVPSAATRTLYTKNPSSAALISFVSSNAGALWSAMNVSSSAAAATAISGIRAGKLGGIDHSTPAIVRPSNLVSGGAARPVIALAGAADGMLHAFYISGGTGMPAPGTELWAYIPSSQLGRIANYAAVVNGSPMVSDVFYGGAWHTLVAITMGNMVEDNVAATYDHNFNSPGLRGTIEVLDVSDTAAPLFRWVASDTFTSGTTSYVMGQASGASHGVIFSNGRRQDVFYVATNNQNSGTPVPAVNVYALDVETGAPVWRWNHSYTRTTNVVQSGTTFWPLPNAVPGVPAVINRRGDGSPDDRIYFGDLEGGVWEIGAIAGGPVRLLYPDPAALPAIASPIINPVTLYRDNSGLRELMVAFTRGSADFMDGATSSYVTVLRPEWPSSTASPCAMRLDLLAPGAGGPVGERFAGGVTVQGGDAYVMTSYGPLSGGTLLTGRTDDGNLRRINLDSATFTASYLVKKGAGEATVNSDGSVIATSLAGITDISGTANAVSRNTNGLAVNHRSIKPMSIRAWLDLH